MASAGASPVPRARACVPARYVCVHLCVCACVRTPIRVHLRVCVCVPVRARAWA